MNKLYQKTESGAGALAKGLGWFSLAVGLLAVVAPRRLAHGIGVRNHPRLLRLVGLREIASGIGILGGNPGWLWSRVAGDAMDLAMMGAAFAGRGTRSVPLGVATGSVAGVAILDTLGALANAPTEPVHVSKAITINRPCPEVYHAWRDLTNLPNFMLNLQTVRPIDETHTHWVSKSPVGRNVEWDAEITEDVPNQKIAWKSIGESDVRHQGSVEFSPAPGDRGTVLRVQLDYFAPAGKLGAKVANLFRLGRSPKQQIEIDLHRFEQWMETGSVTTTEGQPAGRPQGTSKLYDVTATRDY
jgi:uncharacterized membrane protein